MRAATLLMIGLGMAGLPEPCEAKFAENSWSNAVAQTDTARRANCGTDRCWRALESLARARLHDINNRQGRDHGADLGSAHGRGHGELSVPRHAEDSKYASPSQDGGDPVTPSRGLILEGLRWRASICRW
ncbi:hypothetical protein BKA63DRAFT_184904 [Paraphoma chrysanthemicola]|nr:hypothetical protein BKA63DRAFT_184904 [Paraphoma chrysanthemicola]